MRKQMNDDGGFCDDCGEQVDELIVCDSSECGMDICESCNDTEHLHETE